MRAGRGTSGARPLSPGGSRGPRLDPVLRLPQAGWERSAVTASLKQQAPEILTFVKAKVVHRRSGGVLGKTRNVFRPFRVHSVKLQFQGCDIETLVEMSAPS